MAGESPGRSEQRKSSGETADNERDPRLAMFRERSAKSTEGAADGPVSAEADASADAAAVPDVRADQASEPGSAPEPEPGSAAGARTAVGADGDDGPPGASAEPDPEPEKGSGPAEPGEPDDSRLRAAVAAWVATADEPDEDATATADDAAPDDADALDAEDVPAEDLPAEPAAAEPASAEPARTKGGDSAEPARTKGGASAEPAPAKGGDSADGSAGDGADAGEDHGGTDQATAVFKAVPPAPAAEEVDQPTAMLKLPAKDPKGGTRAEPESDVERTSTFVPLKPADERPAGPPRRPGETAARPGQPARPDRTGQQLGPAARTGAQARPADRRPGPAAGAGAAVGAGAGAGAPGLPEAERTKQQPLPPKPPLDLLAELTNKPAPPETPVRTTVRRVKIWTPLLLLLVIVFAAVQLLRPPPDAELGLSATPSYTFEGGRTEMPWPGEGQSAIEVEGVGSLGTEGPQKPAPIASVAKVMTAYVILRDHPIKGKENGPKIKVDQQAEDDGKKGDESTAQVKAGQEYTQRQMLMMLMIPSGNNVARLLGRWDAGSEEKFLEKMNAAAQDLGMTNTKYTDSSGFDTGTVSTPVDQIKLGRAVMKNDVFREIVDMPEVEIPGLPKKIYNNNKILLKPGVNGIKTGSTTPAGGNLLFTASTVVDGETRRIIGAVMHQTSGAVLDDKLDKAIFDSLKLIQKAQEAVTSATVVKKGDVVGYVDDGLGGRTQVVATKDLKAVGWPGLKVDLAIGAAAGKSVPHTGKKGDVVGEVTVGTGPGQVRAPVALQSDLAEPGIGAKLTRLG
ncbi:D-alanyl-D-alanine carboxypeptidase [Streptomyces candidus]|uniref:D-alanyl-D-alanine carboxypeptidase n=1 Tax=Streptomyces candidus TaxID=67283 RepID=A0A7X0LP29_9ACTN|nr:serine hydrolase [Streptomyces candidus]MBB6435507.1 D-alanyl-D-alanine carboxypeptidase [Streptomyces candidus]GHH47185.1 D-alanyl-D-alanine carboxypeptidase [Streptomyces candidus]